MPLPLFFIFILLIKGATLDGAGDGIAAYLDFSNWDKLSDSTIWRYLDFIFIFPFFFLSSFLCQMYCDTCVCVCVCVLCVQVGWWLGEIAESPKQKAEREQGNAGLTHTCTTYTHIRTHK